jgi:hypothetical protein
MAATLPRLFVTDHASRAMTCAAFGRLHLSPMTFHPFNALSACSGQASYPLPFLVAAFQGGNGAGNDDAADTGDLAQTEMLGQDGVAEDG